MRIPDSIVFGGIVSPMLVLIGSVIWLCIDENFNLKSTSMGLAAMITTIQLLLSFIAAAINSDIVVKNVDYIDSIVKKRMNCSHFEMKKKNENLLSKWFGVTIFFGNV